MEKKEYIERGKLLTVLEELFHATDPCGEEQFGYLKAHRIVREAPAADVVEVVHGEWKFGAFDVLGSPVQCPVCGWGAEYANEKTWLKFPGHNFCGHCGAKMDGRIKEE